MGDNNRSSLTNGVRGLAADMGSLAVLSLVLLVLSPTSPGADAAHVVLTGSLAILSTIVLYRLLDKSARQGTLPRWVVAPALVFNFGASAFLAYMAGTALIRLLT